MMSNETRIVQIANQKERRIALVAEPDLILLNKYNSVYELANAALDLGTSLSDLINSVVSSDRLNYDQIYEGISQWMLLPAFDSPDSPFSCLVAGTGLTHKNSALNRQMMHQNTDDKPTDSMQMYQWGVEGGTPAAGEIGVQPEWFYKGNGAILRAHNQTLEVPSYGCDGGEEPEIAGIYIIDGSGQPHRVGFATGNEFSDHVMEKKNYLYLAPSKLRQCAIGPELVINAEFSSIKGEVKVTRNGQTIWSSTINTGEENMAHNLANLEYHHFKYANHRIAGQSHVHFFGADAFSFGSQITLQEGDEMMVQWNGFGRPLKNKLRVSPEDETHVSVLSI